MISFEFDEDGIKRVREEFCKSYAQKPSLYDRRRTDEYEKSSYDILETESILKR